MSRYLVASLAVLLVGCELAPRDKLGVHKGEPEHAPATSAAKPSGTVPAPTKANPPAAVPPAPAQ